MSATFNCLRCGRSVTVQDINRGDGLCESCDGSNVPGPFVRIVGVVTKEERDALLKEIEPTPEQTAAHEFFAPPAILDVAFEETLDHFSKALDVSKELLMARPVDPAPPTPPAGWDEWAQLKARETVKSFFKDDGWMPGRARTAIHCALIEAMRFAKEN